MEKQKSASYLQVALGAKRIVAFGIITSFLSSFGQTFFISVFVGPISETLFISAKLFSFIYSGVTLVGGLIIPIVGRQIDHMGLLRFSLYSLLTLGAAALALTFTSNLYLLVACLFLVRFFGQGIMWHISLTTMARYFGRNRGKASSLAILGLAVGESFLPLGFTHLVNYLGWHYSFGVVALIVLLGAVPASVFLLAPLKQFLQLKPVDKNSDEQISYRKLFTDPKFLFVLPGVFIFPFLATGYFLFQAKFAEYKGWSPQWMALCFTGYGTARLVFTLLSGTLIDRFTSVRVYPFYLLPFALGQILIFFGGHPIFGLVFFVLGGISNGIISPLSSSIYAEMFGERFLGKVRSVSASIVVYSTAIAATTFGLMVETKWNFGLILPVGFALSLIPFFAGLGLKRYMERNG